METTSLLTLATQLVSDNPYVTLAATAIPMAAPIVTKLVHNYGSAKAIIRWNKVRRIYRFGMMGKGIK